MKRLLFLCSLLFAATITNGQTPNINYTDSLVITDIIKPAVKANSDKGLDPGWIAITKTVAEKYDTAFANRIIAKTKIFYYYNKDWAEFASAIVLYTEKYENHNDLNLLNLNANFILAYSSNTEELKTSLSWSKKTLEKKPTNPEYQKTYDALLAKINGN